MPEFESVKRSRIEAVIDNNWQCDFLCKTSRIAKTETRSAAAKDRVSRDGHHAGDCDRDYRAGLLVPLSAASISPARSDRTRFVVVFEHRGQLDLAFHSQPQASHTYAA